MLGPGSVYYDSTKRVYAYTYIYIRVYWGYIAPNPLNPEAQHPYVPRD